ncbi:MAG TPA: FAD-dependent oxidoreductase [Verrucomicrobiae bacterium]|jgi:2-polyprenyl-6-methoxyphenol hydroxylase-like FAD-dependent oxidoreductase|nr:FAD-dependent oxidoreductase [Verrucomicrobiae bacterium]
MDKTAQLKTTCCIVGGGPAGMMTGYLLARAGVNVLVLEKHGDFLRDFRGDTIHPSTLEVMRELGLLDGLLQLPHNRVHELHGIIGGTDVPIADFSHLPTTCRFVALMPQWDFLNFLVEQAKRFPTFQARMEAEVTDLIQQNGVVLGVRVQTPEGALEIRADLVIGADGRGSIVRKQAGLEVIDLGAPMDVLWMRLPRYADDPAQSLGRVNTGAILIMLDRGDYWQCGFVIRKGAFDEIKENGLAAFQQRLAAFAPFFHDRVGLLDDWDKIKLLTVKVDRLSRWHCPGLLCIGDSAHAMSPIGGVGINLAIQDAVAAANLLADPLRKKAADDRALHEVQTRRESPARWTQGLQLFIQNRVVKNVLSTDKPVSVPKIFRLFQFLPFLRRIPGRLVGMGFRPEHVPRAFIDSRSFGKPASPPIGMKKAA